MKNVISKQKGKLNFWILCIGISLLLYLLMVLHFSVVKIHNPLEKDTVKIMELTLAHISDNTFDLRLGDSVVLDSFYINTKKSLIFYIALVLLAFVGVGVNKGEFFGVEHGSSNWATGNDKKKFLKYKDGIILGENLFLSHKTKEFNLNQFIIGGPGSGKTFRKIKPDILQANTNYVIVDIKGEIYRDTSMFMIENGYDIRVLNLIDPVYSMGFNSFAYIKDDKDILILADTFLRNTENGKLGSGDSFWYKAEFALLQAIMFYLYKEYESEEWKFTNVVKLLLASVDLNETEGRGDEEKAIGSCAILDELFNEIAEEKPDHIALQSYKMFKLAAGETTSSILIGLSVRFSIFLTDEIKNLSDFDEMDFEELCDKDKKVAIYLMIPDTHRTFDVISAMFFSQLFQYLVYQADFNNGGSLPRHCRVLMDEFVNCGYIPAFDNIISSIRSRNISTTVIIQDLSQLKARYKDNWQTIIGCCDTFIFMGSPENETRDYVSKILGRTTVQANAKTYNFGAKGGRSENVNYIQRELMTPDELRVMDSSKQIVFMLGVKAFFVDKYRTEKSTKYKWLSKKQDYKKAKKQRLEVAIKKLKKECEGVLTNMKQ